MSSGGVTGQSGDEDGNMDALCVSACTQHRGDSGGRKILPPMVHPMRHTGPPAGLKQAAPGYNTV